MIRPIMTKAVHFGNDSLAHLTQVIDGNQDALEITSKMLLKRPEGHKAIIALKDLNITGAKLAYAYQELYKQDLDMLIAKVNAKDPELLDSIYEAFNN